jgi:molybdopterin molybdotransferase
MSFWQVRIKPGKPIAFGIFNIGEKKIPHLGLPGNPVSCMIGFEIFGRPAILKMMGKSDYENRSS